MTTGYESCLYKSLSYVKCRAYMAIKVEFLSCSMHTAFCISIESCWQYFMGKWCFPTRQQLMMYGVFDFPPDQQHAHLLMNIQFRCGGKYRANMQKVLFLTVLPESILFLILFSSSVTNWRGKMSGVRRHDIQHVKHLKSLMISYKHVINSVQYSQNRKVYKYNRLFSHLIALRYLIHLTKIKWFIYFIQFCSVITFRKHMESLQRLIMMIILNNKSWLFL